MRAQAHFQAISSAGYNTCEKVPFEFLCRKMLVCAMAMKPHTNLNINGYGRKIKCEMLFLLVRCDLFVCLFGRSLTHFGLGQLYRFTKRFIVMIIFFLRFSMAKLCHKFQMLFQLVYLVWFARFSYLFALYTQLCMCMCKCVCLSHSL